MEAALDKDRRGVMPTDAERDQADFKEEEGVLTRGAAMGRNAHFISGPRASGRIGNKQNSS